MLNIFHVLVWPSACFLEKCQFSFSAHFLMRCFFVVELQLFLFETPLLIRFTNQFKLYSSVVFSIFMELCSHHHYWISGNLLIPPAKKSHIHSSCFSFPLNTLSPSYLLYFITIPVSFFFHLCILWDTIILKLSQLIILHWPLSVQVKGRIACISLYIREGSGTPLQYSCLENPMDGGAW